jgi:hypothetical protein
MLTRHPASDQRLAELVLWDWAPFLWNETHDPRSIGLLILSRFDEEVVYWIEYVMF